MNSARPCPCDRMHEVSSCLFVRTIVQVSVSLLTQSEAYRFFPSVAVDRPRKIISSSMSIFLRTFRTSSVGPHMCGISIISAEAANGNSRANISTIFFIVSSLGDHFTNHVLKLLNLLRSIGPINIVLFRIFL